MSALSPLSIPHPPNPAVPTKSKGADFLRLSSEKIRNNIYGAFLRISWILFMFIILCPIHDYCVLAMDRHNWASHFPLFHTVTAKRLLLRKAEQIPVNLPLPL